MTSDPIQHDLPSVRVEPPSALPIADPASFTFRTAVAAWHQVAWEKVLLFSTSLFLFVLAITLMKEGARGLAALVEHQLDVDNAWNSLGFGWLFAYMVMSGSPVAASALTFLDAGIIDELSAFTMITGSRLGASFIVLFIGFIYVIRGRNRADSLGIGLLSLSATGTTYAIATGVGYLFLVSNLLDGFQLHSGVLLDSATQLIFDPVARFLLQFLPRWTLFIVGLAVVLISFNLFDRCLPQVVLKKSQLGRMSRLIYRPWVMLLLGALITLISMSVSVSIGILVPLSTRGFVRRENLIPYIMGANITTFIDTLLAAVLLRNPVAFTVVLVEMVSIALVSALILITAYRGYERCILHFVGLLTSSDRNLGFFMVAIFALPMILMLS